MVAFSVPLVGERVFHLEVGTDENGVAKTGQVITAVVQDAVVFISVFRHSLAAWEWDGFELINWNPWNVLPSPGGRVSPGTTETLI